MSFVQQGKFVIEEADVERRVMDDQFGVFDKFQKGFNYCAEQWLVGEEFIADTVYGESSGFHFTLGIEVDVQMATGMLAVHQFDTPELDDSVPLRRIESGGFGVEHYLSHRKTSSSVLE
jgi:hypothetical protein